ncbi:MAG: hypothetical protein GWM90_14845 [Gemmatimonadetes bacterium]|nr:hypothetical protein [Gemmatimonadota bacterium]NIQ55457.1 hypothetical protein [Gemmatimonadota bacterium]NIU75666.1 hypothetical protein [Gammaproteobacteria bacterium]NIX45337.1 hypothetical protein [Gemmatimonadota bacterium]NIY09626.1 hypothetical protein [Gemmatimonadota bacterium]
MKRSILAALAACLLVHPAAAAAQADLELRIIPRAGVLTPYDWFYEEFAHFGSGPLEWTEAAVLRSTLVGLTAQLELAGTGIWIRGEVLRTLGGETSVVFAELQPASTAGPGVVLRTPYWVPTTLTIATLDLGLPTAFSLPLGIQPYVTAGIGAKRYGFDHSVLADADTHLVRPEEGVNLVTNIGGGFTAPVFRDLGIDFLARDAISHYWDKMQHDIMFLVGVAWQPF